MKKSTRSLLIYYVPLLIMAAQFLSEIFVPVKKLPAFYSEGGPHEAMEAVFLIIALPISIYLYLKLQNKWLKIWMAIAAVCIFYVAGEELSWGQFIFHWHTPEEWARINDQDETNLHNTSTWLDQKPRAVLEIGVLVGGLIIPALRKWRPYLLPEKWKDIYPGDTVVFTAALALLVKVLNLFKFHGHHVFWRGSEVMELYLYYFVLLYLIDRKHTWKAEGRI